MAGILIKDKILSASPSFSAPAAGRSDLSCKEHVSEEIAQSNTGVGPSSKPDLFVAWKSHTLSPITMVSVGKMAGYLKGNDLIGDEIRPFFTDYGAIGRVNDVG